MSPLFAVPDWLPWWVPVAVLVPALLYLIVFLLMPFSVFGLKGRMDAIEARLDEIQGEIRTLVLRMPEARGRSLDWTEPAPPIAPVRAEEDRKLRPPIPPAPVQAPRRPPVEPGYRPPPEMPNPEPRQSQAGFGAPPEPYQASVQPAQDSAQPGLASGEEPGPPRRRLVLRPNRPSRNEPRLDWPP